MRTSEDGDVGQTCETDAHAHEDAHKVVDRCHSIPLPIPMCGRDRAELLAADPETISGGLKPTKPRPKRVASPPQPDREMGVRTEHDNWLRQHMVYAHSGAMRHSRVKPDSDIR